jgi:N-acetylglutamate synthase-like GNAT family acetyltransferase
VGDLIIRRATEEDIIRILELYDELVITYSAIEQSQKRTYKDYLNIFTQINSMAGHNLLIIEHKRKIVGTVTLLIIPSLSHNACPWAVVEHLIVDPNYQGQHLGKRLMRHIINQAKDAGCYKIILSSNKKRSEAHKFYQKLGFRASSEGFSLYF